MRSKFLVLMLVSLCSVASFADGVFTSNVYSSNIAFGNRVNSETPTGITFDGTRYWSVGGGFFSASPNMATYSSAGVFQANFTSTPGLDFRSLFVGPGGTLQARTCDGCSTNGNTIYNMTSPGNFSAGLNLQGPHADFQAGVYLNSAGTAYIAGSTNGTVQQWDAVTGAYMGSTPLTGLGSFGDPSANHVVQVGAYYIAMNSGGSLTAWDASGNVVGTTLLAGFGNVDPYSFSYANNMIFALDYNTNQWQGYDVGLSDTPEPSSIFLLGSSLIGVSGFIRRKMIR